MLRTNIIVECYQRERCDIIAVRRRGGLSITEKGGDNDEVFFWIQGLIGTDEPLVVGDGFREVFSVER
jgi:hypothetical protein